jgi:hypothetical protein
MRTIKYLGFAVALAAVAVPALAQGGLQPGAFPGIDKLARREAQRIEHRQQMRRFAGQRAGRMGMGQGRGFIGQGHGFVSPRQGFRAGARAGVRAGARAGFAAGKRAGARAVHVLVGCRQQSCRLLCWLAKQNRVALNADREQKALE